MRLRAKEEFYLDSLYSEWGRNEWGTPKKGKMKICPFSTARVRSHSRPRARSSGLLALIASTKARASGDNRGRLDIVCKVYNGRSNSAVSGAALGSPVIRRHSVEDTGRQTVTSKLSI